MFRKTIQARIYNANGLLKNIRRLSGCSECSNGLATRISKANQQQFGAAVGKSNFTSQSPIKEKEYAFDVAASSFKFGKGVLAREIGGLGFFFIVVFLPIKPWFAFFFCLSVLGDARSLNMTRVAVISDKIVVQQPWFARAIETLKKTSGIKDVVVFDEMWEYPYKL
jgi:hypothetical protein